MRKLADEWNKTRRLLLFILAGHVYDREELRELVELLAEGRFEDYKDARRSIFPYFSARKVLVFTDAYAEGRLRGQRLMAEGMDWGAAHAVLSDMLWDFQCGREPDVMKHIGRRVQSPADIAGGTAASIVAAAPLPVLALYVFFAIPGWTATVLALSAVFGPLSAAVSWSALRYQWHPALRAVLWLELGANAFLVAIPALLIAVALLVPFYVPF